jgi:hypothetical protein
MLAMYDAKTIPIMDICNQYKISRNTFYISVLGRVYGRKAQEFAARQKEQQNDK